MGQVDLVDELKSYDYIKFDWSIGNEHKNSEDSQEDESKHLIVAKSEDLGGTILGMKFYLNIVKDKNDDKYFLNFSADRKDKYLIPLTKREDLERVCKIYFDKMPTAKGSQNGLSMIKANMMMQKSLYFSKPFKWPYNVHLFVGLHTDIIGVENITTFNSFIHLTPLRQATAFWNEPTSPEYSIFRTIYSGSQFIFSLFDNVNVDTDGEIAHPMILTINYPRISLDHNENNSEKYPNDLPLDCIAALEEYGLPIFTKKDLNEMDNSDEGQEFSEFILGLMDSLNVKS